MHSHWALEAGLPARVGVIAMESNAEDAERAERMLREAEIPVHLDRLRGLGRGFDQRPARSPMKELCGRCGNGKVCVSASGEIFPCVFARFAPLGHIRRRGLRDAFGGPELLTFREALLETLSAAPPCSPERDPGPCTPEKKPGPCTPEKDPGPCIPETGYEPGTFPIHVIATDYPHRDSLFPEAINRFIGRDDLSAAAKERILWQNVVRLYRRAAA
jgi:hypothetical protein